MNPTVETKGIKGKIQSMKAGINVQVFKPNDLVTLKTFITNLRIEFGVEGAMARLMALGYYNNMIYIGAFVAPAQATKMDTAAFEIPINEAALLHGKSITTIAKVDGKNFVAAGTKTATADSNTPYIVQTIFGALFEGTEGPKTAIIKFTMGAIDTQAVFAGRQDTWQQVKAVRGVEAVAMAMFNNMMALGYHDNGGSKIALANFESLHGLWDGTASNEAQHHYIASRRIREFSHTREGRFAAVLYPSVQGREGVKYYTLDLDFGDKGIVSDGKMNEIGAMIDYGPVMGMPTHRAVLDMNYGMENGRALRIGPQLVSANA